MNLFDSGSLAHEEFLGSVAPSAPGIQFTDDRPVSQLEMWKLGGALAEAMCTGAIGGKTRE